jgi:hypothetical protein
VVGVTVCVIVTEGVGVDVEGNTQSNTALKSKVSQGSALGDGVGGIEEKKLLFKSGHSDKLPLEPNNKQLPPGTLDKHHLVSPLL